MILSMKTVGKTVNFTVFQLNRKFYDLIHIKTIVLIYSESGDQFDRTNDSCSLQSKTTPSGISETIIHSGTALL